MPWLEGMINYNIQLEVIIDFLRLDKKYNILIYPLSSWILSP